MVLNYDLFIDEVKDGGKLQELGALVINTDVVEGLYYQLQKAINKREGSEGKIGEIHWSNLTEIEAKVAKDWLNHFLNGPMMFFVFLQAKQMETKLKACERLIENLENDSKVPGGMVRSQTTIHLDIDRSDPNDILRNLRKTFGLLRAFKWDSKGSLLLQLSDLLLGIAKADSDGSLDELSKNDSVAKERKKSLLYHARSMAQDKYAKGNFNALIRIDKNDKIEYCLGLIDIENKSPG